MMWHWGVPVYSHDKRCSEWLSDMWFVLELQDGRVSKNLTVSPWKLFSIWLKYIYFCVLVDCPLLCSDFRRDTGKFEETEPSFRRKIFSLWRTKMCLKLPDRSEASSWEKVQQQLCWRIVSPAEKWMEIRQWNFWVPMIFLVARICDTKMPESKLLLHVDMLSNTKCLVPDVRIFFLPFSSWRSSLPYPPINKANNIKSSSRFLTLNFWLLQPQRFELVLCGWRMWPPFLFERWSDEQGSFMLSWFLAKFTLPSWVQFAVMTVAYYYFFGLSKSKGRNSLQWGFNHLRKFCITFS